MKLIIYHAERSCTFTPLSETAFSCLYILKKHFRINHMIKGQFLGNTCLFYGGEFILTSPAHNPAFGKQGIVKTL